MPLRLTHYRCRAEAQLRCHQTNAFARQHPGYIHNPAKGRLIAAGPSGHQIEWEIWAT